MVSTVRQPTTLVAAAGIATSVAKEAEPGGRCGVGVRGGVRPARRALAAARAHRAARRGPGVGARGARRARRAGRRLRKLVARRQPARGGPGRRGRVREVLAPRLGAAPVHGRRPPRPGSTGRGGGRPRPRTSHPRCGGPSRGGPRSRARPSVPPPLRTVARALALPGLHPRVAARCSRRRDHAGGAGIGRVDRRSDAGVHAPGWPHHAAARSRAVSSAVRLTRHAALPRLGLDALRRSGGQR